MAQTGAFCQPIEHKDDFYEFHASHVAVCDSHKCAEQLKQLAGAVKLRVVPTTPALVLPEAVIREGATWIRTVISASMSRRWKSPSLS